VQFSKNKHIEREKFLVGWKMDELEGSNRISQHSDYLEL